MLTAVDWPCTIERVRNTFSSDRSVHNRCSVRGDRAPRVAKFEEIRLGRANVLLILLTDKAYALLSKAGPKYRGRGGVAHVHFANWIAMVGKNRGYHTEVEWLAPGTNHPVDAAYQINGSWHAFEVVVTSPDLMSHIQACLTESNAVETLTIVTSQIKLRDQIRADIEAQLSMSPVLSRVRFEVMTTYIKDLWP